MTALEGAASLTRRDIIYLVAESLQKYTLLHRGSLQKRAVDLSSGRQFPGDMESLDDFDVKLTSYLST